MLNGSNLVVPTIVTSCDVNSTSFCVPNNDETAASNLQNFMRMPEPERDPFQTLKHFKELRSYSLDENLQSFDQYADIEGHQFNDYIPSSCPDLTEYLRETKQILISQYSNATNSPRNFLPLSKGNSRANSPSLLGAHCLMPGGSRSQSRLSLMRTPNGSTMDLSETNSIRNMSSLRLYSSSNVLNMHTADTSLKVDKLSCYSYRIKCKNWLQNVMY